LNYRLRGESCGCPDRRFTTIVALRRISAGLSVLGSSFILWDILRDSSKYVATHHQLVLGISFFDAIGSFASLFGTAPLPKYSGTPGARGSYATCQMLGFFSQVGQTAYYFNLALAVYFWLVICVQCKAKTLLRGRNTLYAGLTLLGVGLALGALPFYTFGFHVCQVLPPPAASSWYPSVFFFIAPLSVVLAGTTLFTILVLLEVRRREKATLRYTSRQYQREGRNNLLWTRKVFWKSLWYLAPFYLTLPVLFAIFFVDITDGTVWMLKLSTLLGSSQGFWNCCVYIYSYRRRGNGDSPRGQSGLRQSGSQIRTSVDTMDSEEVTIQNMRSPTNAAD